MNRVCELSEANKDTMLLRMRVTHKELILIGIRELQRQRRCRFTEHH